MSTGRFLREAIRIGQFRPQFLGRMTAAQIAALVPANYQTGTTVTCTDGVNAERGFRLQAGAFSVDGGGSSAPVAFTSRALAQADMDGIFICASAQVATVNTAALSAGFSCAFKGVITFAGTATVTDVRTTGSANPWCTLVPTGTGTWDCVGSKA